MLFYVTVKSLYEKKDIRKSQKVSFIFLVFWLLLLLTFIDYFECNVEVNFYSMYLTYFVKRDLSTILMSCGEVVSSSSGTVPLKKMDDRRSVKFVDLPLSGLSDISNLINGALLFISFSVPLNSSNLAYCFNFAKLSLWFIMFVVDSFQVLMWRNI